MEQLLDPFPWYRMMREKEPVHYDQQRNMWEVFRYDDVQRVLSDHASFSSHFIGPGHPLSASIVNTDQPRHRQLRSLVTQAFTPRTVAQLAARITTIVHELLDRVAPSGE